MAIVQADSECMEFLQYNSEAMQYMDKKYRYIKRNITAIKSNVWTTQASEFYFIDSNWNKKSFSWCTITAQYAGNNNEWIEKLIDWNTSTKYCTWHNPSLRILFDFGSEWISVKKFSRYQRYTANDEPDRDPKTWTIQGSNDNVNYDTLSTVSTNVTSTRYALAGTRDLTY